jgi:hypothetical protein
MADERWLIAEVSVFWDLYPQVEISWPDAQSFT